MHLNIALTLLTPVRRHDQPYEQHQRSPKPYETVDQHVALCYVLDSYIVRVDGDEVPCPQYQELDRRGLLVVQYNR
jgi:hypothetical protein